jgi:Lrp/AsnC family transcriptional regulator
MSTPALDSHDVALLRELQKDASLSLDALADRVNLSRNACWRRMRLLEEQGIIRGKVALLDPSRLNAGLMVFIRIKTSRHSAEWADSFRQAVTALPEIIGAYRTSGDVDYLLQARVPNVAAYDALYQKLIQRIDMNDVSASFVMEELKETSEVPLGFV